MDNVGRSPLMVYGHDDCGQALVLYGIEREWHRKKGDSHFRDELKQLVRGNPSAPTVIFPDGVGWIEPPPSAVLHRLQWRCPHAAQSQ